MQTVEEIAAADIAPGVQSCSGSESSAARVIGKMTLNPTIYTLGPEGTNCAAAARWWLERQEKTASAVILHETLELAFAELAQKRDGYLLSCAAYPDLHTLIFTRLGDMELCDSFIMPTHAMVFAAHPDASRIRRVVTHPAPQALVAPCYDKLFANSNADAAVRCRQGDAEACITTSVAAERHGLKVLEDFGPVPMVFMLHRLKGGDHACQ